MGLVFNIHVSMVNNRNKRAEYSNCVNLVNMAVPATADKSLLAFLNSIARRVYFKDDSISDEFLRTEVLGGIPEPG